MQASEYDDIQDQYEQLLRDGKLVTRQTLHLVMYPGDIDGNDFITTDLTTIAPHTPVTFHLKSRGVLLVKFSDEIAALQNDADLSDLFQEKKDA